MKNNIITVTSPLLPDLGEFNEMLKQIWDAKWITNMGQFHQQLEQEFSLPYFEFVYDYHWDLGHGWSGDMPK